MKAVKLDNNKCATVRTAREKIVGVNLFTEIGLVILSIDDLDSMRELVISETFKKK